MNGVFSLLLIGLSLFCTAMSFYSIGYKEGNREGYTRGRSISRHISNGEVKR